MSRPEQQTDQRQFLRQALVLPVLLELPSNEVRGPSLVKGETRDVSNQGAYFRAQGAFKVGQRVHLRLEVPPGQDRKFRLEVFWEAQVTRVEPAKPGAQQWGVAVKVIRGEPPKVLGEAPRWVH